MKKLFAFVLIALSSCSPSGSTSVNLNGDESSLPSELEGMKVYKVWVEDGNYVRVAILNNQINSLTYPLGKSQNTTIVVNNPSENKTIEVKEIISENDSIIVCKK